MTVCIEVSREERSESELRVDIRHKARSFALFSALLALVLSSQLSEARDRDGVESPRPQV